MANNDLSNTENILIKTDENNLIYVDPNSVLVNNQVQPRSVSQEKMVMYVNLEADIIPRTTLAADGITDSKSSLRSIAKGTLNFLSNNNGKDYDSTWTDSYVPSDSNTLQAKNQTQNFSDETGQSFGIDSISIQVKGANFIPQVVINFIDVRGKTLFESSNNSPYKAFFHLPWPIFYLTIKGFYGKAIRYRLHLVSFSSRFNSSSGNFEVTTKFVGSTYAFMNDIPLMAMLNAPYMFIRTIEGSQTFNEQTGLFEKKALKSSKGYQILKSVYSEMKQKKLIPQDFPIKTLREICAIASTLDKKLEQKIFNDVIDPEVLDGLRAYREEIKKFEIQVNAWKNKNLDLNIFSDQFQNNSTTTRGYALKSKNKLDLTSVTGATSNDSLEGKMVQFSEQLKKYQKTFNDKIKSGGDAIGVNTALLSNTLPPIGNYFSKLSNDPSKFYILFDKLISDLENIKKVFFEQNVKIEKQIEKKMNEIIKDPSKGGFGFEPTVRNLFAILLANAEVYVRLMKDVHNDAFNVANERKTIIGKFSDESVGESIYPWPEIKKVTSGDKQREIAYPGDPDLFDKLQSFNGLLWPEVSFVEEYIGVSTNVKDPLVEKEGGVNDLQYIFESNQDESKIKDISQLFRTQESLPYSNRTPVSFLYEIYERAKMMTLVDSYDADTLTELANIEFKTIQEVVGEELDILSILKDNIKLLKRDEPLPAGLPEDTLLGYMEKLSPFERFENFKKSTPTTTYLKDLIVRPFKIEQFVGDSTDNKKGFDLTPYQKLNNYLLNYTPEPYRKNIFPFSSKTYLSYINKNKFTDDEFKFSGVFKVGERDEFISTPYDNKAWIKPKNQSLNDTFNLFTEDLSIGDKFTNILNTPYFHKQLYSDFNKTTSFGKYAGSAYLLVNSLPYLDLKDNIKFENQPPIRMSSIFREIGGTHFVPYHLIVKWGSIYHRYKKKKLEGIDILTGFTTSNTNTTTTNINGQQFFDVPGLDIGDNVYQIQGQFVSHAGRRDVGIHPYYDAIFHQVVNGYNHFVVTSGSTSFESNVNNGSINLKYRPKENGLNYWTQYVDNSKFNPSDLKYTLLPCDGFNPKINLGSTGPTNFNFEKSEQFNFRLIWKEETIEESFSGKTFTSPSEYNRKSGGDLFQLSSNQEKVYDLIATFSPQILDEFEEIFLQFSSELVITEGVNKKFSNIVYDNFQLLLKDIVTVQKKSDDGDVQQTIIKIANQQVKNLTEISTKMTSATSFLKLTLGNPKEFDSYILDNYVNNTESFGSYNGVIQSGNTKYIDLYVGENPETGVTYQKFFEISDIALTEENVLLFRPLILIYGGYKNNGGIDTAVEFKKYLKDNILNNEGSVQLPTGTVFTFPLGGADNRLNLFLTKLINQFSRLKIERDTASINFVDGYNNKQIKVELYNTFKSFNDKWVAGNSLGQRLLFEEFLFLDRANRDIGSKTYLNISKFIDLLDTKNNKANLYSTISMLLKDSGFDMRALPAYVNFYGTNISNRSKITPSKKVAENLFGTFLDVDYEESSPKIIVQYIGPTSKHIADGDKGVNKFNDDSFDISNRNKNPLIVTLPEIYDVDQLNKSNKVVAFEVSFGDQYQNIFKGVSLDQTTLRNTSESFVVLENLARSESGSGAYNVDVSLFDLYRQASYSCEVTCMGNVMIQPTMYFYLKNIPMFRGTYWITEVSHNIRNNNIETVFKGTRIPVAALPDPEDSFVSSYKSLLDKITNSARAMVKKLDPANAKSTTEQTIKTEFGNFVTDMGGTNIKGEELLQTVGISEFGIPFNGFGNEKYIQKVKYKEQNGTVSEWFRARAVRMGMESKIYTLTDETHMSLLSSLRNKTNVNSNGETGLKWVDLKNLSNSHNFYSTKFQLTQSITADKIITGTTEIFNPNQNLKSEIKPNYNLDRRVEQLNVSGPVNIGPFIDGYGIGLSNKLMKDLKVTEGDVIYFRIK